MKILIYGVNYAPEMTGIGKYSSSMAEWLAGHGHEVRVLAGKPYYPQWKVHAGYSSATYSRERIAGVDVWRCPIFVPAQPSGLKRIVHLGSYAISSFPALFRHLSWKPDLVFAVAPSFFCAPAAWTFARIAHTRCWLHIQDFEVDAAIEMGVLPFAWLRKLAGKVESILLGRFDVVSSISRNMVSKLVNKGAKEGATFFFPNWACLDDVRFNLEGGKRFRDELNIPESAFVALYSGNIGEKQGLEIILSAAEALPNIHFVICGEGSSRQRLINATEEKQLRNVLFLPLQPIEELPSLLSMASVHLIIQKGGMEDLVMPSKLTNILAVGGYSIVTASRQSELGRIFTEAPALGCLCPPEDLNAFITAIRSCAQSQAKQPDHRIRDYAEKHIGIDEVMDRFVCKMTDVRSNR